MHFHAKHVAYCLLFSSPPGRRVLLSSSACLQKADTARWLTQGPLASAGSAELGPGSLAAEPMLPGPVQGSPQRGGRFPCSLPGLPAACLTPTSLAVSWSPLACFSLFQCDQFVGAFPIGKRNLPQYVRPLEAELMFLYVGCWEDRGLFDLPTPPGSWCLPWEKGAWAWGALRCFGNIRESSRGEAGRRSGPQVSVVALPSLDEGQSPASNGPHCHQVLLGRSVETEWGQRVAPPLARASSCPITVQESEILNSKILKSYLFSVR